MSSGHAIRHDVHVSRGPAMIRKLLLGLSALSASTVVLGPAAGATVPPQGKIGPSQSFAASVNGQTGIASPAVIEMRCFGPIRPGQMGHPLGGQHVEVYRPEVILSHNGFTGPNANSITAFFNAPPPSPLTTPPVVMPVTFTRYGVPRSIPTSLLLPCAGKGNVYFVPLPMSPLGPARDAVVPVSYVSQP